MTPIYFTSQNAKDGFYSYFWLYFTENKEEEMDDLSIVAQIHDVIGIENFMIFSLWLQTRKYKRVD